MIPLLKVIMSKVSRSRSDVASESAALISCKSFGTNFARLSESSGCLLPTIVTLASRLSSATASAFPIPAVPPTIRTSGLVSKKKTSKEISEDSEIWCSIL